MAAALDFLTGTAVGVARPCAQAQSADEMLDAMHMVLVPAVGEAKAAEYSTLLSVDGFDHPNSLTELTVDRLKDLGIPLGHRQNV